MRIALISDVHSNLVSLDAVLADIDQRGVDQIVFLGDAANLGPQPAEALARLRERAIPGVMGNHDSYLLDPSLIAGYVNAGPMLFEAAEWSAAQLMPADFDYLRALKATWRIESDDGASMLCVHGSPISNEQGIFSTTPSAELDALLAEIEVDLLVCGHTHLPLVRRHEATLIVNAGSVGVPFERQPGERTPRILPWAEYAIVTLVADFPRVELCRVPIDLRAIVAVAKTSDNPFPWLSAWPVD